MPNDPTGIADMGYLAKEAVPVTGRWRRFDGWMEPGPVQIFARGQSFPPGPDHRSVYVLVASNHKRCHPKVRRSWPPESRHG